MLEMKSDLDYRFILRSELVERIKKNPRYSVRAMARDLDISPAFLSQVFNGRRKLSETKGVQISKCFDWSKQQKDIFLKLVRLASLKEESLRTPLLDDLLSDKSYPKVSHCFSLSLKKFKVVSDWYHFAILELTEIEGFQSTPQWISQKLGIGRIEAELAITRLLELGLLTQDKGGLKKVKDCSIGDVPSEAIRKFHGQHLVKAQRALREQPFNDRHLSGTTLAINSKKLPQAIKKIDRFRLEIMKILETGKRDSVYQLAIQLFRLSEENPK